jgi:hypothetical protein
LTSVPRIALIGRVRSGKDYIADKTTFLKHSLATPAKLIAREFFGNFKKKDPGARNLLTSIGQIGRAYVSNNYPLSIERASFIFLVRQIGKRVQNYGHINWDLYGKSTDFWTYALLNSPPTHNFNPGRSPDLPILVNDLRFPNDKIRLEAAGFETWLVLCTEQTRRERMVELGEEYDGLSLSTFATQKAEHQVVDVSESYATQLSNHFLYTRSYPKEPDFPIDRVIWNDHRNPPSGSILQEKRSYLSATDFWQKYSDVMNQTISNRSSEAPVKITF